jgi:hypothetical protein
MVMPKELYILIEEGQSLVENSPEKRLNLETRIKLYQAFGISTLKVIPEQANNVIKEVNSRNSKKLLKADLARFYLSILTAKYISPIWEGFSFRKGDEEKRWLIQEMIEIAEKLIENKVKAKEVIRKLENTFHFGYNVRHYGSYNMYCVVDCAYNILEMIVYREPEISFSNPSKNEYVLLAEAAFCAIDENPLGLWDSREVSQKKPINYSLKKRLEFWTWWLTEAIPQAWELAHTTYRPES